MSDWINSAIAAGAALAGSALTAFVSARAAKRHSEGQERSELVAALQAYGYAVTNLGLEIAQLPPTPGATAATAIASASERLPLLNWTVGAINRRTIGRRTGHAVDLYNAALSRLLLLAPESLLRPVETVNELMRRADAHDESWDREWSAACAAFTRAARGEVRGS